MAILATFVVQDDAVPTPNPVPGTKVRIYNSGDVFQTELTTDVDGEAEFVLAGSATPGTLYIIRLIPPVGYSVPDGPTQTVRVIEPLGVDESNIFDFVATPPSSVPESLNPLMCRLTGYFVDASLLPIKDARLTFHPVPGHPKLVIAGGHYSSQPTIVGGKIIAKERTVKTDDQGYVDFELPRGGEFRAFIEGLEGEDHNILSWIYVPDAAGAALFDVLYPIVTMITYEAATLNLAVGESVEFDLVPQASNLQPMDSAAYFNELLEFTMSDPTKASVNIIEGGKLLIVGLAAGSTNLEVARKLGSWAPRNPEVADLIILPSVPVITIT